MSEIIHAKKGNGLDDIFKDYVPQQLEEQFLLPKTQYSQYGTLTEALYHYDKILHEGDMDNLISQKLSCPSLRDIKIVVPPPSITALSNLMNHFSGHRYHRSRFGPFLSKVVQNSYDAGYNHFLVDLCDVEKGDFVLSFCQGESEAKPLNVKILGAVGNYCAYQSKYIDLVIDGDVGSHLADGAAHSIFSLSSSVNFSAGDGGDDLTFKTSNPKTREQLLHHLSTLTRNLNEKSRKEIIFVHPDGNEEVVRRYNYKDLYNTKSVSDS